MNPILQWLGSAAAGAVLLAIANGVFAKKKLSAEATKIITDAASGVVERLEAENARVIASNTILVDRVEQLKGQVDDLRRMLTVHAFWDTQAVEIAKSHGIDLPPPPPLNPT